MDRLLLPLPILVAACLLAAQQQQQQPAARSRARPRPQVEAAAVKPEDRGVIEGMVVDAVTGAPLAKATIMAIRTGGRTPNGIQTDASGRFQLRNLEPGSYRLTAQRNRYSRQEYGAKAPGRPGTTITLAARQHIKEVVFRLMPAAVVTGRVIDEEGEPVAHARISLMQYRYVRGKRELTPGGAASTNDLGEYRIFGVAPGRYYVSASAANRQMMGMVVAQNGPAGPEMDYQVTYYPGVSDPGQTAPLELRAGEDRMGIDFRLLRTVAVRVGGRVAGSGKDVVVNLAPRGASSFVNFGERRFTPVNSATGRFEFTAVTPGSYTLHAFSRSRERQLFARLALEVGNSNLEGIEVVLTEGASISGRVRIDGQPTPDLRFEDLRVFLQPLDGRAVMMGSAGNGEVDAGGAFRWQNLAPDTYTIRMFRLPPDYYLKAAVMGGLDVLENGMTAGSGGELELTISPNGGRVEGSVADDKKNAASGAVVALVPGKRSREDLFRTATTDQYGRFTISGIPPGDYKVFSWDNVESGAPQDPAFLEPYENRGRKISLREKGQEAVELQMMRVDEAGR